MPIYEYQCRQCQKEFNELVLDMNKISQIVCPECGSSDPDRIMSRFAYHRSEEDRLDEFDANKTPGDEFYKDSRNVGLRAKKRAKELGVDLGPQIDEIVDRARSVKNLDDLEKISSR